MAKVKTKKKLTPAQQRVARENNNPLYSPAVQLSGHDLAAAARKLAGMEIDPQVKALNQQATTTKTQGLALADRASGYYQGLAQQEAQNVATQQAIAAQLGSSLKGIASDSAAGLDAARASEAERQAADQQLRGSGAGGNMINEELTQAQARTSRDAQAFRSAGAIQGAGSAQLMAAIAAATAQGGGETQGQISNRLQSQLGDIGSKKSAILGARGGLIAKNVGALRQSSFDNLVTARGLDIKGAQLAADAADSNRAYQLAVKKLASQNAHNAATTAISKGNLDLSAAKFASQEEKDAYQRVHKLGPYKPSKAPGESASSLSIKRGIGNALTIYQELLKPGKKNSKGQPYTLAQIDAKAIKAGAPPDVRAAASELAQFGYLTSETLAQLQRAGVRVPKSWKRPKQSSYAGGPGSH